MCPIHRASPDALQILFKSEKIIHFPSFFLAASFILCPFSISILNHSEKLVLREGCTLSRSNPLQNIQHGSSLEKKSSAAWPLPFLATSFIILPVAVVRTPFLAEGNKKEWGFHCSGCAGRVYPRRFDSRRKFSRDLQTTY